MEILTLSSIQQVISYTIHDPELTINLSNYTSSRPLKCPVTYQLQFYPDANNRESLSSKTPFVSYQNTTNTLKVFYDVDNKFSPKNGGNLFNFRLVATLEGDQVQSYYNFTVNLIKNCAKPKTTFNVLPSLN